MRKAVQRRGWTPSVQSRAAHARQRRWRFADDEQQAWWDGLATTQREGFVLATMDTEPAGATEASVAAQVMELLD